MPFWQNVNGRLCIFINLNSFRIKQNQYRKYSLVAGSSLLYSLRTMLMLLRLKSNHRKLTLACLWRIRHFYIEDNKDKIERLTAEQATYQPSILCSKYIHKLLRLQCWSILPLSFHLSQQFIVLVQIWKNV